MSDFLKITTPLVNKNQAVTPKPGTEAVGVLNLANTTKVLQTHNQSEILKQNNGLFEDGTPTLLLNLLKDPGVTATYLQNIGMDFADFTAQNAAESQQALTKQIGEYVQIGNQASQIQNGVTVGDIYRSKMMDSTNYQLYTAYLPSGGADLTWNPAQLDMDELVRAQQQFIEDRKSVV